MPLRGEVNMNRRFKTKLALMSIPAAAGFIIFYVVPFFRSVGYSFVGRMVDKKFVGFQNYIELFQNEYFRMALTNTVIFSVVGVTLILIISLALSAGLVKLSSTFSFIKSFFVMPYVLPSASIIFFWQLFFDTERYAALEKIDGLGGSFEVLPLYVIFLWKNIGINIILITSAMVKVQQEVYEAAVLDGAHGVKLFTKITMPLISPTLYFVGVLSFVNSLKIFKESYLFYNSSYPPNTAYMIQNFMNNHFQKLNYQTLSTAVVIFTLVIAVIIFLLYKLENKMSEGTY